MFEKVTKALPTLSAVALAVLAVFNVGYFSRVGLHFLGVIDISNIVYSFGLVFGVIGLIAAFIGFDFMDYAGEKSLDYNRAFKATLALKVGAVVLFIFSFIAMEFLWPYVGSDGFLAFSSFFLAGVQGLHGYVRFRSQNRVLPSDYLLTIFIGMLAIAFAGRAVAQSQITSAFSYTVTTKDDVKKVVRIVRSSSMGFIVASEGAVTFIPTGEIKLISADPPKK